MHSSKKSSIFAVKIRRSIKVAILGYGNIGKAAEEAVQSAPDMELAGIYHHNDCLDCLDRDIDVMLVCTPTREVQKFATVMAARGICTVDSFDIHGQSVVHRNAISSGIYVYGASSASSLHEFYSSLQVK